MFAVFDAVPPVIGQRCEDGSKESFREESRSDADVSDESHEKFPLRRHEMSARTGSGQGLAALI
jgi:hypothetical protein